MMALRFIVPFAFVHRLAFSERTPFKHDGGDLLQLDAKSLPACDPKQGVLEVQCVKGYFKGLGSMFDRPDPKCELALLFTYDEDHVTEGMPGVVDEHGTFVNAVKLAGDEVMLFETDDHGQEREGKVETKVKGAFHRGEARYLESETKWNDFEPEWDSKTEFCVIVKATPSRVVLEVSAAEVNVFMGNGKMGDFELGITSLFTADSKPLDQQTALIGGDPCDLYCQAAEGNKGGILGWGTSDREHVCKMFQDGKVNHEKDCKSFRFSFTSDSATREECCQCLVRDSRSGGGQLADVCPGVTHKITEPMISDDILAKIRHEHHIEGDQVIVPLFGGKAVSKAWSRFFSGSGSYFGLGAKQQFPPYIVLQVEWKPWQTANQPPQCGTVITGGQDCAAGLQHVKDYLYKAMEYYRSAAHHVGMGEANDEQQFMMDLFTGSITDAYLRGSSCGGDDSDWADMHEDAAYHDLDRALYQQHWALKLLQTLSEDPKCSDAPGWPNPNSIPAVPCTGCECTEYQGFGLADGALLCASMGNPFELGFSKSGICYQKWQSSITKRCNDQGVCEDVESGEYESVVDKRFVANQWRNLVQPAQIVGKAAQEYKENWINQRYPERSNICE